MDALPEALARRTVRVGSGTVGLARTVASAMRWDTPWR